MASDRRLLILHGMWIVEQHMHVVHVHDAVQQATCMFHFGMRPMELATISLAAVVYIYISYLGNVVLLDKHWMGDQISNLNFFERL